METFWYLCVTVYKCLHGMAPQYLSDLRTPVAEVPGRQRLRSADRGQLLTPRYTLTTSGGRSFTCAASSIWNALLPDYLKDTALSLSYFEKQLKTFLFSRYYLAHRARQRSLMTARYINLHFTFTLPANQVHLENGR